MTFFKVLGHGAIIALLTVLTQLGGLAWLIALFFRHRLVAFLLGYAALSLLAIWVAPQFGRQAIGCGGKDGLQVRSWLYCALNRTYVTPELLAVLHDLAAEMARRRPGTQVVVLDAGFPYVTGFPLLPHLSHDDGKKADIAFFYADQQGYLPGRTRSPIGYLAFEDGPTTCANSWPSLRWNLAFLQPLWPDWQLEENRMRDALNLLAADDRVGKIFLEPHLKASLGLQSGKIRFQGCRAARHDDHIHIQL